jgi:hypothetical protein
MERRLSLIKGCNINSRHDAWESYGFQQSHETVLRAIFSLAARHNFSNDNHDAVKTEYLTIIKNLIIKFNKMI